MLTSYQLSSQRRNPTRNCIYPGSTLPLPMRDIGSGWSDMCSCLSAPAVPSRRPCRPGEVSLSVEGAMRRPPGA